MSPIFTVYPNLCIRIDNLNCPTETEGADARLTRLWLAPASACGDIVVFVAVTKKILYKNCMFVRSLSFFFWVDTVTQFFVFG